MPGVIRQDDVILRLIRDVNDIQTALRRVVANLPLYDISNESTPPQITTNVNNYVPGNFDVLRLSTDAARTITGFSGGVKGRFLRLFNVGAFEITIAHLSGLSSIGNKVKSPTSTDMIINAGGQLVLYYDITNGVWISSYATNSDRISVELRLSGVQSIPDDFGPFTNIIWTNVIKDTGGFFDPLNPSYITIPETGWYNVSTTVAWDGGGAGDREIVCRSLPTNQLSLVDSRYTAASITTVQNLNRSCYLLKGLTVKTLVYQKSGSALNVIVNASAALGTGLLLDKM